MARMFLTGHRGRPWRWLAVGLLAALVVPFVWLRRAGVYVHGGSLAGILYGSFALALIVLLLAFGWRKRAYRSTLGTLEGWLHAHVWLGLLTVVAVLFHSGFRFQDRLAVVTFAVMVAVVASGLLGVALYTLFPRLLTEVQSNVPEGEIDTQLNQIRRTMARLASGRSPAFQGVYRGLAAESIPGHLAGWRLLLTGARRHRGSGAPGDWTRILERVAVEEQEELRQMLVLSRQHAELHERLARQRYYRNWLEVWLYIHVPLSVLLAILVIAHLAAVFYYADL